MTLTIAAMPAFNEERSIAKLILGCRKYVDEVVIVDDGSEDSTASVAESLRAYVIRHPRNLGYGAALRSCFEAARKLGADKLVILDCDGQHDPEEIPKLLEPLNSGPDVVIGSRFCSGRGQDVPAYRRAGMKVLDALTNMVGGIQVSDSQSGYRAYSRKAIESIQIRTNGMSAGSEVLIQTQVLGLKIAEVGIRCNYDVANPSTHNPIVHGAGIILDLFKEANRRTLLRAYVASVKALISDFERRRLDVVLAHSKGRLLDIGCGENRLVRRYGNGIGVDVYNWGDVDLIVEDSSVLPFQNGSFDTISFVACLNHIPNREEVLAEARRLMKEDGRLLITMIPPTISMLWHKINAVADPDQLERGMKPGEAWGFTERQIRDLLEDAGFEIIDHERFVLGLNKLYVAGKKTNVSSRCISKTECSSPEGIITNPSAAAIFCTSQQLKGTDH